MTWQTFNTAARELFLRRRFLHGSDLLDLAIEHGLGACADTHAERFLRAWGTPNHPAPNPSQRAFATLGGCAAKNWQVCAPGTELAWYWQLKVFRRCAPAARRLHTRKRWTWRRSGVG